MSKNQSFMDGIDKTDPKYACLMIKAAERAELKAVIDYLKEKFPSENEFHPLDEMIIDYFKEEMKFLNESYEKIVEENK